MPAVKIVRDFAIGLETLNTTDKATVRRFMMENQASKNRKTREIVESNKDTC